jgi:hypothetical protein
VAAVAAYVLAARAERVLQALGGYSVHALPFTVLPLHAVLHNWPASSWRPRSRQTSPCSY